MDDLWQKDPANDIAVDNFTPISYLPLMWKLTTGILADNMYDLDRERILHEEQEESSSTFCNGSCNLSRNDFGRCMICYTVQCVSCNLFFNALRDKLHETLHSVTALLSSSSRFLRAF